MQYWVIFSLLVGILGYCSINGYTQGQLPRQDKLLAGECQGPGSVLDVTSERMTFDQRTRMFIFEENVQIRRCAMTITCDRLHVTKDAKNEDIEHITATGNVHVQQGTQHVTAERADYFPSEQRLVFAGNPHAWDTQEQREMTGEEIIVFLQNEKVLVKRAHVLFHPRNTSVKRP